MAYNYSPEYLVQHRDLMRKLVQIAASGELLVYEGTDWRSIETRLRLVRSVLANMSRNLPEYKDIRTKVRCWTEYKEDSYSLYVGQPAHRLSGRPPGEPLSGWKEQYVPIGMATEAGCYRHPDRLDSPDAFSVFVGKVSVLPTLYRRVECQVEAMDEGSLDYFADVFSSLGWIASSNGDGLLILERAG